MKKSKNIVLTTVLLSAIISCREQQKDDWIYGDENGRTRDTTVNNRPYRHYGGLWFPIIAGRISPHTYNGASASQISHPSYTPSRAVRSGGFGSSSRSAHS
jgi:hypothetical protein